jgi:hypothetical protein
MAKISGLVWAEFSHEQLVSWQFSMGKSDRLLDLPSLPAGIQRDYVEMIQKECGYAGA